MRENKINLLMIKDGKKWHCLAVKILSAKINITATYRCLKKMTVSKYNHGEKSMKLLFVIYADTESLLE